MLSVCFRQDEEPHGHLEQLPGTLGPEQGTKAAFSENHLGFPVPLTTQRDITEPVLASSWDISMSPWDASHPR